MSFPFDATLKGILGNDPADLASAFSFPAIEPARPLNVDLSTLSAATDVAFGFGMPMVEIVDLNFQSGPNANVDARLFLYNAAFYLKFGVPVRSILVLLRPKAETNGLTGNLTYVCGGKRAEFQYDLVRLWEQPVELFLEGGLGLLPLASLCRMAAGKSVEEGLREVILAIDRRLAQETDHAKAVRVMTAAFILAGLRVQKDALTSIFEGVKIMHESTAFDAILDEGRAEGRVEGALRILLRFGRKQCGAPNASIEASLAAIRDLDRLERMFDALDTAKSWDDLLAIA
jgi:hypothetical protein